MKNTISFLLIAVFLFFLFSADFAFCARQEEFSFSVFARTYGKSLGDLAYNSLFDFNRNNSIDNDDLKVYISNTPLKSLVPFLSVSEQSNNRKKKTKEGSKNNSVGEGDNPLDIDKDGDVDEQDVNLMKNLLTATQMINTFSNYNVITMALTVKPPSNAPTLASFYAYTGYTPEAAYNVSFLYLSLEADAQFNAEDQGQAPLPVKDAEDSKELKSTTASNLLFLNMQVLQDVIKSNTLAQDAEPYYKQMDPKPIPAASQNADIQQINNQTMEKQQLMSDRQQKKRTLKHLSTNTPVMVDQNSRNKHYDKSVEKKETGLLKL